jgi:hypothetical protein
MGLFEFMICMRGDRLKLKFLSMRLLKNPFCHCTAYLTLYPMRGTLYPMRGTLYPMRGTLYPFGIGSEIEIGNDTY